MPPSNYMSDIIKQVLTDGMPSLEEQNKAVESIEIALSKTKQLIVSRYVGASSEKPCYLPITDDRYIKPTGEEVKHVVSLIMAKGYSKGAVSRLVGVSDIKNRTILRWENDKADIPYAAWRLLLDYAGLAIDLELPEKE